MWGKIMIPIYGLWLHGLYGLYGPCCPLSPERPLNFITHSLKWLRLRYSMQNLMALSFFFFTSTTGLAQGLSLGLMIPCSSILSISLLAISCCASLKRLGDSLIGLALPVSMVCFVCCVRPSLPSGPTNVLHFIATSSHTLVSWSEVKWGAVVLTISSNCVVDAIKPYVPTMVSVASKVLNSRQWS